MWVIGANAWYNKEAGLWKQSLFIFLQIYPACVISCISDARWIILPLKCVALILHYWGQPQYNVVESVRAQDTGWMTGIKFLAGAGIFVSTTMSGLAVSPTYVTAMEMGGSFFVGEK